MGAMASQITDVSIVYSTACSGADQRKIKAPRHWPLWGDFPSQRASNAENVSIWWRHHCFCRYCDWVYDVTERVVPGRQRDYCEPLPKNAPVSDVKKSAYCCLQILIQNCVLRNIQFNAYSGNEGRHLQETHVRLGLKIIARKQLSRFRICRGSWY